MSEMVIEFRKSNTVTNSGTNGGRMGSAVVLSGQRHALFPIVSKAERISGVTRFRKEFLKIKSPADAAAQDVFAYLEYPSTAGDCFLLGRGDQADTQAQLTGDSMVWLGCGKLNGTIAAGVSSSITLEMESTEAQVPSGGYLHLSSNFLTGQTIDSGAGVGDSVAYSDGIWHRTSATDQITHPLGITLGAGLVMTAHADAKEEWLPVADLLYEEEVIGSGNGSTTSPALSAPVHRSNGICRQPGKRPVVQTTCGGITRAISITADGSCSGYCTEGQLDLATGNWTTNINWTTAPDNGAHITITYRENPFFYSGQNCTINLAPGVTPANSYNPSNTWGAGCIHQSELKPLTVDWQENSAGGAYDETSHPIALTNHCPYDLWTLQFTATGAYHVSAVYAGGNLLTGQSVAADGDVIVDGQTVMTIPATGWSGAWQSGDTITFTTHPAAIPLWLKQAVPAGTSAASDNFLSLGWQLSQ